MRRGRPRRPRIGGLASSSGNSWGEVVAVATGQTDRERDAVGLDDQVVLRAGVAAVDRRRPNVVRLRARVRARDDRATDQVQLAGGAQFGDGSSCNCGYSLGPVPQPPPARPPGTADHLGGQLVPGDAGLEHEHDPGRRAPIVDRLVSREPVTPWRVSRQQRHHLLPQRVRDKITPHGRAAWRTSPSVHCRQPRAF